MPFEKFIVENEGGGRTVVRTSMHAIALQFDGTSYVAKVFDTPDAHGNENPVALFSPGESDGSGRQSHRQPGIEMIAREASLYARFPDALVRIDFSGPDATVTAWSDPWPSKDMVPDEVHRIHADPDLGATPG